MNDTDLKSLLAKMLPDTMALHACGKYYWIGSANGYVLDTELLHLASLVEAGLAAVELALYIQELERICEYDIAFATWQQRTTALAAVKGVTL